MPSADAPSARQLRRAEAMRHLPALYSLALRLRDAGLADELIVECLAVEKEALQSLVVNCAHDKGSQLLDPDSRSDLRRRDVSPYLPG